MGIANLPGINDVARPEIIEQFLSPWTRYEGNFVFELRYKHSSRINQYSGRPYTYSVYCTIEELMKPRELFKIAYNALDGYHAYIGVHPRYKKLGRRSGRNYDIPACYCVYMDADEWNGETLNENLEQYHLPHPTVVMETGNGLHLWWFLKEPLNPWHGGLLQRHLVKTVLSGTRISREGACDLARILRIPDTLNWKNKMEPRPVRLLEVNANTYDWRELLCGYKTGWQGDHQILESKWTEPVEMRRPWTACTVMGGNRLRRSPTMMKCTGNGAMHNSGKERLTSSLSCFTFDGEDEQTVQNIIRNISVKGPGQRNRALAHLVAKVRKAFHNLSIEGLSSLHHLWFTRYSLQFSGTHSEQESLDEFFYCWERMPIKGRTAIDFFTGEKLEDHPGALHLTGTRNQSLRHLAAIVYTACITENRERHGVYLSCETAQQLLGMCSKQSAWHLLKKLVSLGLVERIYSGNRLKRLAARYRIPPRFMDRSSS